MLQGSGRLRAEDPDSVRLPQSLTLGQDGGKVGAPAAESQEVLGSPGLVASGPAGKLHLFDLLGRSGPSSSPAPRPPR